MPPPRPPTAAAASAHTRQVDTRTAAMELADALAEGLDGDADLVLLFASFHHRAAFGEASTILRRALRTSRLVGTTAEWVVGRGRELEGSPGMAALALRLPGVWLSPVRFDLFDGPAHAWEDEFIRQRLAATTGHRGTILFADPFSTQAPILLDRIARALGSASHSAASADDRDGRPATGPIIGGLASGSSQPGANVLVLDDTLTATGAVGVSFAGAVGIDALVSPGCRPIGATGIVTKASGNVIEEIGGRPAVEALREAVESLPEDDRPTPRDGVLIGFAIDEYRDRFGRGDFLLRGVLGADAKRGTLIVGEPARVGRTVRFHRRDRRAAIEDLQLLLDKEQMRDPPLAVMLATCSARGKGLFGSADADAKEFARRLGDPPLAGLFAGGEIGPTGSRSWLHGHTVCAALIRPEPVTP